MTGAAVEPANGVKPAIGVVLGVVLNDRVGRAPEAAGDAAVPAPVVGRANVARGIGELVGAGRWIESFNDQPYCKDHFLNGSWH